MTETQAHAIRVITADYWVSSERVASLPASESFEFAIIGRSNVGKSSFINRITCRKKLARTSSTPGRTQQVNLFKVEVEEEKAKRAQFVIADLPGYGFAKLSKQRVGDLAEVIGDYLEHRQTLNAICLLNDCRRDPENEELQVQAMASQNDLALMIVLTKCDKLKRSELKARQTEIAARYGLSIDNLFLTGEGLSIDPFWQHMSLLEKGLSEA